MTDQLYHKAILDLARAGTGRGKLQSPTAGVTVDNPLCGDRVTIEIVLREGRISEFAHRVRGCALCEAAAAAIGAHAVGATPQTLAAAARSAADVIAGAADAGLWPELAIFRPVREHRSRHRCVTLPFEAVEKAIAQAKGA